MSFVLINHGWTNTRQRGHWQRTLSHDLRLAGHHVNYPQYPDTDNPKFEAWSSLLRAELELILELRKRAEGSAEDSELIVIAHSLGCINFMKSALQGLLPEGLVVDRLLLVAPPAVELLDPVDSFKLNLNDKKLLPALNQVARNITLVASDADPWLPNGIHASFGKPLGLEPVIINGAKHISSADGWSSWQGVTNWISNPEADLTLR